MKMYEKDKYDALIYVNHPLYHYEMLNAEKINPFTYNNGGNNMTTKQQRKNANMVTLIEMNDELNKMARRSININLDIDSDDFIYKINHFKNLKELKQNIESNIKEVSQQMGYIQSQLSLFAQELDSLGV